MKSVVLSLFSRQTPNGKPSPKSYPYYSELTKKLNSLEYLTVQLGVQEEPDIGAIHRYNGLPVEDLIRLAKDCDYWISCDNFLPHLMQCYQPQKRGIVVFSKSDPKIFGYPSNINLLKSDKFLRPGQEQFQFWNDVIRDKNAFISPDVIISKLKEL